MRVTLAADPFAHLDRDRTLWSRGAWPARWVAHPAAIDARPIVVAYRRSFRLDRDATVRLHVSADERYQLFCDGTQLGRGPERGDPDHWFFETYELTLPPGRHTLVARVWSIGPGQPTEVGAKPDAQFGSPLAQLSVYHGFLCACDDPALAPQVSTGVAPWDAKLLPGYTFTPPGLAWGTGARLDVDGHAFAWNHHRGDGDDWQSVTHRHAAVTEGRMEAGPSHLMRPAQLPAMLERYVNAGVVRHVEDLPASPAPDLPTLRLKPSHNLKELRSEYQSQLDNRQPLHVPARTCRRLIIDLENYYCAYPLLVTTGGDGATVHLAWSESLFETPDPKARQKGDRDAVDNKYFIGVGDTFRPDGGTAREFETLWWAAGRYLELVVRTAAEPLDLNLILRETRYPLEMSATFESSDPRLAAILPLMLRGLQMCAHETYMDCPYFEQLMYVGDTRLEALCTYVVANDDRLARKAITLFNAARSPDGLTPSRYPSRVRQVIPPFALLWVAMVHDFALWRDDPAFVRAQLQGVRAVIDAYSGLRDATDGLVHGPANAWNFVDWVPSWKYGVPPDAATAASAVVNFQLVYALHLARDLEQWFGEPELAARCARVAREVTAAINATFWEPVRGLYADDRAKRHFSEHAQCLALLSGALNDANGENEDRARRAAQSLLHAPDLARTTIYFTHYLFEAYRAISARWSDLEPAAMSAFFNRLSFWFDLEDQGFVAPMEEPEPTRSDCHAWGAHPLFHYFATILGIRPAAPGFAEVETHPRLGPLTHAQGTLSRPGGQLIRVTALDPLK